MIVMIDYQQIVLICAECMANAVPIGMIFGLCSKACDLFYSMAFGKERVRL